MGTTGDGETYVFWSPKGGSGTSVTAAGLALQIAASGDKTLLVDTVGEQPMILGLLPLAEDDDNEVWVTEGLSNIVGKSFDRRDRVVVIDAGRDPADWLDSIQDAQPVMVVRCCYLGVQAALRERPPANTKVVVIHEPGRALRQSDLEAVFGGHEVIHLTWDPAVTRAVDSGMMADRTPRSLAHVGQCRIEEKSVDEPILGEPVESPSLGL